MRRALIGQRRPQVTGRPRAEQGGPINYSDAGWGDSVPSGADRCFHLGIDEAARQCGVSSGAMETHSFKLELPQGTTIEAAYWAGLKHIEETLNLKAYADYRPIGSEPHPTMSGMGIWSYSYKA